MSGMHSRCFVYDHLWALCWFSYSQVFKTQEDSMFSISELIRVRTTLQVPLITGTTKLAETLVSLGEQVNARLTDPEAATKYYQDNWAALIGPPAVERMIGQPSFILSS